MSRSHTYYTRLNVHELERIVQAHQDEFEQLLGDTFSEQELTAFEKMIDSIAAIYVQPIMSEITFDDFYAHPAEEEKQRHFFESCKSSISLENIPYLESNPFQVTYLIDLLWTLDEVLIDKGGISELCFKKAYLDELKKYKTLESLIPQTEEKKIPVITTKAPVSPIDFLIQDIYKELNRLHPQQIPQSEMSEKVQRIYEAMKVDKLDSDAIFKLSGLIPKDFDDNLEKLKFFLKKIN